MPTVKWLRFSLCQKNTSLRLIDFLRTGARKPTIFDSISARVARTPCTRPGVGKLNHGPSQFERTCGHGNSDSVSECGRRGGGLSDRWALFGVRKKWELKQFCDRKKMTVLSLMLLTWWSEWTWNLKKGLTGGVELPTYYTITLFHWELTQHSESSSRPYSQLFSQGF